MTAAWPAVEIALDRRDQRRRLHRRDQMIEEALLGAFEGRARGGLGLRFSVPVSPVILAASQRRVEIVVNDLEGAGIGIVDADLLGA